jgi:hypothetical protein
MMGGGPREFLLRPTHLNSSVQPRDIVALLTIAQCLD